MTTEELIAAGLPVDPIVEGAEHAASTEDACSASGSKSREDGEVQSDDSEDIGDVDVGISDLVKVNTAGPLHPHSLSESPRSQPTWFGNMREPGSSLRVLGEPRLMSESLPLGTEKLSSFVTSSFVD
jgi:hypothetical protein